MRPMNEHMCPGTGEIPVLVDTDPGNLPEGIIGVTQTGICPVCAGNIFLYDGRLGPHSIGRIEIPA